MIKGKDKVKYSPWSEWKAIVSREDGDAQPNHPLKHNFDQGGTLRIYLNKYDVEGREAIIKELVHTRFFQVYKVQAEKVPRYQFLICKQLGEVGEVTFYDNLTK
jgi:hypothetical protein